MISIFSVLVISVLLFSQSIQTIKEISENTVRIILSKHITIANDKGLFYKDIDVHHDGFEFYVLDKGNKHIHVFDYNGAYLYKFAKEGNGPGELSNPFMFEITQKNVLVLSSFQGTSLFTKKGKFVKYLPLDLTIGADFAVDKNAFYFVKDNSKVRYTKFNEKGDILSTKELEEWSPKKEEHQGFAIHYLKHIRKFKNGYVAVRGKDYIIDFYDKDFNVVKSYQRHVKKYPLKRKKRKTNSNLPFNEKKVSAEMDAANLMKPSIWNIVGVIDQYVFLHVASEEDNVFYLNIIDGEGRLHFDGIVEFEDFYQARLEHRKLIVIKKNDDVGPYFESMMINVMPRK